MSYWEWQGTNHRTRRQPFKPGHLSGRPEAPAGSWWIGLDRDAMRQAVEAHVKRWRSKHALEPVKGGIDWTVQ